MTAGDILAYLGGCSPFFISSSISSLFFGGLARKDGFLRTEEGLAFEKRQLQMQREFEDKRFDQELCFKREMLELGRYYQQTKSKKSFDNDKKIVEFREFQSYWPLEIDIQAVWDKDIFSTTNRQLTVILSHPNLSAKKLDSEYSNMCESLRRYAMELHNIKMKGAIWKGIKNDVTTTGGIAQNMNIHYIMPYNDNHFDGLKEKIKLVQLAIMGLVRDNFMAIEFQSPPTLPEVIRKEKAMEKYTDIRDFLIAGYRALEQSIANTPEYKELCSKSEIDAMQANIEQSIKTLNA